MSHTQSHLSRRAFLKGAAVTGTGLVLPNWGGLVHARSGAEQAAKAKKRCILLWMNGGASQIDTFDHLKAEDMRQGAIILASFLLNAANADNPLPRGPVPTQPNVTDPFAYPDPDRER